MKFKIVNFFNAFLHNLFDVSLLRKCNHNYSTIYVEDKIYNQRTDNDDLEDIPAFIRIVYCDKCGKIVRMSHRYFKIKYYSNDEIKKFEQITKINLNKLTLWKEKN